MTQRVTLVSLDTNNKESPLNVDASGNLGVNLEGELAVGELKLAAADPGLVALLAGLVGTNSKTFSDVVTAIGNLPQTQFSGAVTNTGLTDITNVYDSLTHALTVSTKGVRSASPTEHRNTLTAPDLLGAVSTAPTVLTGSGGTFADSGVVEGSLTATAYYGAYAIRNGMGVTMASAVAGPITPTSGHSMRFTIPTAWRITDSDAIFDFFLSVDAGAPKHVCSFTAAQLAASGGVGTGCVCTTAETPSAVGTAVAAWACDIGVVGAGMQTTASIFAQSTAYELSPGGVAITPVSTAGYNNVDLFVDVSVASFASATQPALTLIPLFLNDGVAQYHVGAPIYVNIENQIGASKRQVYNLTTNGASVMILVVSIANTTINRIDITPTSVV